MNTETEYTFEQYLKDQKKPKKPLELAIDNDIVFKEKSKDFLEGAFYEYVQLESTEEKTDEEKAKEPSFFAIRITRGQYKNTVIKYENTEILPDGTVNYSIKLVNPRKSLKTWEEDDIIELSKKIMADVFERSARHAESITKGI